MSAVRLLRGEDESLLSSALGDTIREMIGDADRVLAVDELDSDDYPASAIVDAAQTPPFLTERRVVVARRIGRFGVEDLAPLVAWLADPLPTTDLVLTAGGGRVPKALLDAVKDAGGLVVDTDAPAGRKERGLWLAEQFARAAVRLDAGAKAAISEHLGEDLGRLEAVLQTLESTFGSSTTLHAGDVEPFIGEAGSVPPWDLTDAIDRGDTAGALAMLRRMVRAGERHPLQVMAILHTHYGRLLRLDGSGAHDEKTAAELLAVKSGFQARKALDQSRRLGHDGIARAIALLAGADLDLRGAKEWPDELVMEVLVARLARLIPVRASARR
jgi:DNA polymerase-3 subunit delta